jgi:hypothetical protein
MIFATIMRDSAMYVDRFHEQVDRVGPSKVVVVEGDSSDATWEAIQGRDWMTLKCEHGGPYFGSVDEPMRWRQIALACNVALTAAVRDNDEYEPIIYIESDLIWEPETIESLVGHLDTLPAVAPMSMQGVRFYDTWGHVKGNRRFSPYAPYHPGLNGHQLVTIDSAGSCIAMTAKAAAVAEFSLTDCIRGVGRSLHAHGYSLWLDPSLAVRHP